MTSSQPPATPHRAAERVPACAIRSLTTLAEAQLAQGRRQPALAILRAALLDVDPGTAPPQADLIAAARLYADTLGVHEHGDWHSLRWARYAHRAATAMYGAADARTIHTARTLARNLAGYHHDHAAIELRQQLVDQLTDRDGPADTGVLAAHVDLAIAQHVAGYCHVAITGLTRTWQRWRRQHGDADLGSVAMLLQLAAMLEDCGQHHAAARRTEQAWRAYRTPVSPGSRAPARFSVDWLTGPDHRHDGLCRGVPRSVRLGDDLARLHQLARTWQRGEYPARHPLSRAHTWRELLP
ncbi:hypothetical protein ACQP2P_16420 [Dactylosporangium sp. CA-139114]|uniref:hypothetical protein n=1 Tax=Dactylosporangium sp. CA-139114 TaxID=3239931 RepID=UPI003D9A0AC4